MTRKIIIFLCLIIMGSAGHPFYLSVTSLRYNAGEKALQGSLKVFSNDLESALRKLSGEKTDLIHPADSARLEAQLRSYIEARLKLKVGNVSVPVHFIGYEQQEESTWLFLEFKVPVKPKRVVVETYILYDFLPQQMNIVQLEIDGKEESGRVTNPDRYLEFNF